MEEIKSFLEKLYNEIENATDLLNKKSKYKDVKAIIKNGVVYTMHDGTLEPASSFIHGALFDGFEASYISDVFLPLYSNLLKLSNEPLAQFAYRSLVDAGIRNVDVLFKGKESVVNRAKILSLIIDYISAGNKHNKTAENLFTQYKDFLNDEDIRLTEILILGEEDKKTKTLKTLSQRLNEIFINEGLKIPRYELLDHMVTKSNGESLSRYWSHVLHVNSIISTKSAFISKSVITRTYVLCLLTGINVLHRIHHNPSSLGSIKYEALKVYDRIKEVEK